MTKLVNVLALVNLSDATIRYVAAASLESAPTFKSLMALRSIPTRNCLQRGSVWKMCGIFKRGVSPAHARLIDKVLNVDRAQGLTLAGMNLPVGGSTVADRLFYLLMTRTSSVKLHEKFISLNHLRLIQGPDSPQASKAVKVLNAHGGRCCVTTDSITNRTKDAIPADPMSLKSRQPGI